MPSTLDPAQLAIALKRPVALKRANKEELIYDPDTYDKAIEGLFRRKWLDEETFLPRAKEIWSALFQPVIGNSPSFEDVPLLLSVVEDTKSDVLRDKAIVALKLHLVDCSGVDDSLKSKVQEILNGVLAA
jgi:hypothetical protein